MEWLGSANKSQQTLTPSSQVAQSDKCGNHGVQDKRWSFHESWLLGHRNKHLPGMASNHEKDYPEEICQELQIQVGFA